MVTVRSKFHIVIRKLCEGFSAHGITKEKGGENNV